jgi:hypothetical protein
MQNVKRGAMTTGRTTATRGKNVPERMWIDWEKEYGLTGSRVQATRHTNELWRKRPAYVEITKSAADKRAGKWKRDQGKPWSMAEAMAAARVDHAKVDELRLMAPVIAACLALWREQGVPLERVWPTKLEAQWSQLVRQLVPRRSGREALAEGRYAAAADDKARELLMRDWLLAAAMASDPQARATIQRNLDAYAEAGLAAGTAVMLPGEDGGATTEPYQTVDPTKAQATPTP